MEYKRVFEHMKANATYIYETNSHINGNIFILIHVIHHYFVTLIKVKSDRMEDICEIIFTLSLILVLSTVVVSLCRSFVASSDKLTVGKCRKVSERILILS